MSAPTPSVRAPANRKRKNTSTSSASSNSTTTAAATKGARAAPSPSPSASPSPSPTPTSASFEFQSSTGEPGSVSNNINRAAQVGVEPAPDEPMSMLLSKRKLAMQRLSEVGHKLESGEYVAVQARATKAKGTPAPATGEFNVWDHFNQIVVKDTGTKVRAVQCGQCEQIMSHVSVVTGTRPS